MTKTAACVLGLVAAWGCRAKPQANPSGGEALASQGQPRVAAPTPRSARDTALTVWASPDAARELALPTGATVVDVAASPTRPAVVALVHDTSGNSRLLSWEVSQDTAAAIAGLPAGFAGRAIASDPAGTSLFVAGTQGGQSQILRLDRDGSSWRSTTVFATGRPIERLIVGPRPFSTADGDRYRLFFAAGLPDGNSSLRSVTETGTIEYQLVGPQASVDSIKDEDDHPDRITARSGVPMAFHPRGEPLLWRDQRGCAHLLPYDYRNWSTDTSLTSVPCGAWVSFAPNGAEFLVWRSGVAGIGVVRRDRRAAGQEATAYTFVSAPVSVPDGRGVVGVVSKGGGRAVLVYSPIAVPLADVANAWQLNGTACDEQLFSSSAGLFRERDNTDQLYSLYEAYDYGTQYPPPFLVTTDLEWENFGAAYNGVFILLERQQAVPAFEAFVAAANVALTHASAASRWARTFAAITAFYHGDDTGEAGRIAHQQGKAFSTVLDSTFNYAELTPRGHYTSSPEMGRYFRAVHYLTTIGRVTDAAPLGSLPADVRQKAMAWIDVYRAFIAPSRSKLIWQAGTAPAAYAKHPWQWASVFPLSWGIDNEALESSVYHSKWPVDEQIVGPRGRRLIPSGVDVAEVFGNALARSLLAGDVAAYPRLGPVLDGIGARRPAPTDSTSLYQRWLDAIGVEWADSSTMPGAHPNSPVWPAKRLQTGLASWATLREATILVTERPEAAEAGEGGFEELLPQLTRGYVEPAPRTFEAIAGLYDALAATVAASHDFAGGSKTQWNDEPLQDGVQRRLAASSEEARRFAQMATRELRGEALSDKDYDAIRSVGGSIEHQFLIYKSLAEKDLALSVPDPLPKVADVAGGDSLGLLEAAVGGPLEWDQIVPFFGRRQIAIGSVYSYYEFTSGTPYTNELWRSEIAKHPRPAWIQPLIAPAAGSCRPAASR
jgi:hypothetical protein